MIKRWWQENKGVQWVKKNKLLVMLSVVALLFFVVGFRAGTGCAGGGKGGQADPHAGHDHGGKGTATTKGTRGKKSTVWTCSMHPQIKLPKPGKCPICFMDLIPLQEEGGGGGSPRQVRLSPASVALAELQTSRARRRPVVFKLRMDGRVDYDETRVKSITAWVAGRLERLYVDYTGVPVRKGEHLVKIYSPELLASQEELLQSLRAYRQAKKSSGAARRMARQSLESARRKLSLFGLKQWQIRLIEKKGKPRVRTNIYAPIGGIVIEKKAREGMYVKVGTPIYTIADLSRVWIVFDAYERDLPWLHPGQKATFTTLARPGEPFEGTIVYIDPVLNPQTRTVTVRANVSNAEGILKPHMFVRGSVQVSLNARGEARKPDRGGKWTCPMHPEVLRQKKGRCPICGMPLEKIPSPKKKGTVQDPLVIPETAPLITGKRAVVYVEKSGQKKPTYEGREVVLGPQAGKFYVVLKGLKAGEQVVTHGAFKLDSELQIRAKPSMMSPDKEETKKAATPQAPKKKVPVSRRFLQKLAPLYEAYFALSQALVQDKAGKARSAFGEMLATLKKISRPGGEARSAWESIRADLFEALSKGKKEKQLKPQRIPYEDVSRAMIRLADQFGHLRGEPVYLSFCPMAFDYRGAYWLQPQDEQIWNPYFGSQMIHCGSVKRRIAPRFSKKGKKKGKKESKKTKKTKKSKKTKKRSSHAGHNH